MLQKVKKSVLIFFQLFSQILPPHVPCPIFFVPLRAAPLTSSTLPAATAVYSYWWHPSLDSVVSTIVSRWLVYNKKNKESEVCQSLPIVGTGLPVRSNVLWWPLVCSYFVFNSACNSATSPSCLAFLVAMTALQWSISANSAGALPNTSSLIIPPTCKVLKNRRK